MTYDAQGNGEGFGAMLRHWRTQRRMSQLDLALDAAVSARHISFLESGRAQPSRAMVHALSEALNAPRDARNAMLVAAGFAPAYRARSAGDGAIASAESALAWMLERHHPYPGIVLDRHWRLLRLNPAAAFLFGAVGLVEGDALLPAFIQHTPLRAAVVNWPALGHHMLMRLQAEREHFGDDPLLDAAIKDLQRDQAVRAHRDEARPPPALIPIALRMGDTTLQFVSTIAQFGAAEDIAIADWRIELMFPADEATRAMLLLAAASAPLTPSE